MRKLIVTNIVSLDGYYEGPGGNVMVLPMDQSFDAYCAERLAAADTLLLGRNTYEGFKGFWPQMADNPDATPTQREISRLDDAIEKVVVSDTITADQTEPWRDTTRIVRAACMPTSRSPSSSAGPARPSWSSAAARSGTIC